MWSCSHMIFLRITFGAVESKLFPWRGPTFWPMEDKVLHAYLFHQQTSAAALGSLLAQGWVLLKDPLVSSWGVFPRRFHLKYSRIHVRNLPCKFGHQTKHKTYQGTLEHTNTFQGLTFECLGRLTSRWLQIKYAYYEILIEHILSLFKHMWGLKHLNSFWGSLHNSWKNLAVYNCIQTFAWLIWRNHHTKCFIRYTFLLN